LLSPVPPGGQQTATGVHLVAAVREATVRAREGPLLLPPKPERHDRVGAAATAGVPA
jgi:hypothetical protein